MFRILGDLHACGDLLTAMYLKFTILNFKLLYLDFLIYCNVCLFRAIVMFAYFALSQVLPRLVVAPPTLCCYHGTTQKYAFSRPQMRLAVNTGPTLQKYLLLLPVIHFIGM